MVQPPIKHIVGTPLLQGASTANAVVTIATAVINPDPFTNQNNIKNANKIYGFQYQIDWTPEQGTAIGDYTFQFYFGFNINGAQPMPTVSSTGASHINNQVFHEDGALQVVGATTQSATPHVWRGHIKLPKAWTTFNDGDALEMHYTTSGPAGGTHNLAYKFIYKEFYP